MRHCRIKLASRFQIQANTACTTLVHAIEIGVGNFLVDGNNGASAGAELLYGVESAGIISAVHGGLNDDDTIGMKRTVQGAHLSDGSGFRRVNAARSPWKFFRIAKDVRVAIAGASRHIEVNRSRRLRSACVESAHNGSK